MILGSKTSFYFGYKERSCGHALWTNMSNTQAMEKDIPWSIGLMDTGLLKNGKRADVCDGKVFWTCANPPNGFWHAFVWWDRSGDRRPNSNSGFYVRGFGVGEQVAAFGLACSEWPDIVQRQRHQLVLQ